MGGTMGHRDLEGRLGRWRQRQATRRAFLGGAAALLGSVGLALPQRAHAARPAERKFLFFFASGGWDTTTVLDPHFDTDAVDMDPDTVVGRVGNLVYTFGPDRAPVDRFFRRWGARTAIVNGMDVHSVGHDSAAQFVMTGTTASSFADWPTLLAARSALEYPLPHVVFSGPTYPGTEGQAVVRAGGGTLLDLIDGSIVGYADKPAPLPPTPADSMIDAFVHRRVADFAAAQRGAAKARAESLLFNLERAMELEGRAFEAGLSDLGNTLLDQAIKATEMFRLGLSRCAMIRIPGGWDSHNNNRVQAPAQVAFFAALDELMEHLATTPGHAADYLIDEVVVVATSEIGRTPRLNGGGGKDHWPYGSTLVVGPGVNGNRVLGKTDASLVAQPIDLQTGLPSSSGDMLGCEHVGLALLELGGLDPAKALPGVPVFRGLLRS